MFGAAASAIMFSLTLLLAPAWAQPVTTLNDQTPVTDISSASVMWIDTTGQASIRQVAGKPVGSFTPTRAEQVYALGHQAALWQRYRLSSQTNSREDWILEFPQPLLDRITVYQSTADGSWTGHVAGDLVPVAIWPQPGRYAQFRLDLPDTAVREVYVQIHNVANISVPVRVTSRGSQTQRLQLDYLTVGIVFGTLLLLIIACVTQSWVYRDRAYAWYALYASLLTLTMAAWTGVAGHLLWNHYAAWNDIAPGFLGVLAGGAALLFVNHLCGVNQRQKWIDLLLYGIGFASLPLAIAYAWADRRLAVPVISVYLVCIALLGIAKGIATWRRKDRTGLWVVVAFSPISAATVLLVASVTGLVQSSWLSRYGLMIGLIIEVPFLLIALNMRSRERHSVEARAQVIVSQDALTGLLTEPLFNDRLKQVIGRAKRYKEPAAVVYIDLVNYAFIKQTWGVAVAEQSLLRSVIKLRRILRDVDTVGRIGEARFALVLEGAISRQAITEMAARMIAAGLMPLKGLKPEVLLQFHIVGILLTERLDNAEDVSQWLSELMASMSARTRRPIRFVEPELTRPMNLGAQSDFGADSTNPKRRAYVSK